jgi:DNA-binding NarL/FixJ family response regulator
MPKTILIADDSALIRDAVCTLFKTQEDYEVCAQACNGAEAIELAKKHKPDVIILDIAMPVMDGIQAARELKRIMPEVPLILFTQYAESFVGNSLDVVVDAVVSKNDGAALLEKVRSLVPA